MDEHINTIIQRLKKKEISFFLLPEEYQTNIDIARYQRRAHIRRISKRGYDVISDKFFVEELISFGDSETPIVSFFEDFTSYSDFVNKRIYENACYYQLDYSKIPIPVNPKKIKEKESYIEKTVDDYSLSLTPEEQAEFEKGENNKILCKEWTNRFNSCKSFDEFMYCVNEYKKSNFSVDICFFFYNFINADISDLNRFQVIMQYMSTGLYPEYKITDSLCLVYDPMEVIKYYNYQSGSKSTNYRHKKNLKLFVEDYNSGKIRFARYAFFDKNTHYFCEITKDTLFEFPIVEYQRNFETFEDFISYRHHDLTNCDLTYAIDLSYDFSTCVMDKTTKLPLGQGGIYKYEIKKLFDGSKYMVSQTWHNSNNVIVKKYDHEFTFFFDFVKFLKGDLSGADLTICDGLQNLRDWGNIKFDGAKMPSKVYDEIGFNYENYSLDKTLIKSFNLIENNESNTSLIQKSQRKSFDLEDGGICYISDLHIMHKLAQAQVRSETDAISVIRHIVEKITEDVVGYYSFFHRGILLIGGDVSSDWNVFQTFIRLLREELNTKDKNTIVIFVLGNHELWDFSHLSLPEIIEKYDSFLQENGMYLLQNSILHIDNNDDVKIIKSNDIISNSDSELRNSVLRSRIIFFGGIGFSGLNQEFNANNGIYRDTIRRDTEIEESSKFDFLYQRVCSSLPDKKIIIFTHMPKDCWSASNEYQNEYVYVSGHTHRNEFHDDNKIRIYRDNQIGYHNRSIRLKRFSVDNTYDIFSEYADGIYEISVDDYREFYRGKNMRMEFYRDYRTLYLLKREGYYCFIIRSKVGTLSILNGGALKLLDEDDIKYYYENMSSVIEYIITHTSPYTEAQEQIASELRRIGGKGRIHGCIIDIDYYSHVYLDPISGEITFYWASDIINKEIYPSFDDLLNRKCPELYGNYKQLLANDEKNLLTLSTSNCETSTVHPQLYLATDIYEASREVLKMQKLKNNILTIWVEPKSIQQKLPSPEFIKEDEKRGIASPLIEI